MSEEFSGGAVIIVLAERRPKPVKSPDEEVEELKDRILAFPFIKPTNNDAEQDGA